MHHFKCLVFVFWMRPKLVCAVLNVQPFYDAVATALRLADPNHIVFFEPVTWSGQVLGDGYTVKQKQRTVHV